MKDGSYCWPLALPLAVPSTADVLIANVSSACASASDTASTGSTGSGVVEDVFVDYFESIGRVTKPTAFDGRSDYDAFVAAGVVDPTHYANRSPR